MGKNRNAELGPPLARVRAMMAQSREALAANLLGLDAVHTAMVVAAGEGLASVTIDPGKPVDLRETDTAKGTIAALRADGFRVEWSPRLAQPGEAPVHVLKVSW